MSTSESSGTSGQTYTQRGAGSLEEKGRELGRRADEVGARVQTGIRDKVHEVSAAKEELVHRVQDGRARVEREVQDHPVRTLLCAVGVGAILGILLSRRSRN